MSEVVGALLGTERLQELSNASPCCFDGSFVCLSDECLELCEHHLDGIEVGAVGGQEEEMCTDVSDRITGRLSLVTSQIIEDDDVPGFECRDQTLPNPCGKSDAVDGTIEDEGGNDAIAA